MELKNVLNIKTREEFRGWLLKNHSDETECWIVAKRGRTIPQDNIWYLDAVEEAICFGWIDSTTKKINGVTWQRFMPRSKKSEWTELNKERARRLGRLGLLTEDGKKALPDMSEESFLIDDEIKKAFKDNPAALENFLSFPPLYQRVRIDSIQRYKKQDRKTFENRLEKLLQKSSEGVMFGEWNDYGRLL